jgi:hypothetical protein
MDEYLLVLIVTPTIENAMVDWLLDREDVSGFTSMPINGHGASVHSLTAAEQVAGRQRQIMFQLHLSKATADALVDALRRAFGGSGMHYWLTPLLASGHLQ